MTKDEIFYKKQKDMPTNELLELAHKEIGKMCKTGGRSFTMSIPVLVTDTDMILSEALNRLKALEQVKINVDLCNVINWVAVSENLPPKNERVWLYNIKSENYGFDFVHEYDLTTQRFQKNWTHWAIIKPPCL